MDYTLHNKYEVYNDCVYIIWNKNSDGELMSIRETDEPHIVNNTFCILRGIPDEFYHVEIDNMIEVKDKSILNPNEFEVDYKYGLIRFHHSLNDKRVIINEYRSRGNYYYPANRIYYSISPIDGTVVTMYDILEKIQEELKISKQEAIDINNILKETIENAKITDKNLRDAIELAKKLILELGIDQYVKWKDVGNETGKIPLSNGKININLNAEMVGGKKIEEISLVGHTHTKKDITDFPTHLPADGGNSDTVDGKHASDLADKIHTHIKSDITDLIIGKTGVSNNYNDLDNKPISLPANGGNADTVDGKHANDFIYNTGNEELKGKWDVDSKSIIFDRDSSTNVHVNKALYAESCGSADKIGSLLINDLARQTNGRVDLYVNINTGNDNNDGSSGKPLKTIQKAFDICPKLGQHDIFIHVAPGDYNENIVSGGFISGNTIKLMADTEDYNLVKIKGIIRMKYILGEFRISNMSIIPDYNIAKSYIYGLSSGGKTSLMCVEIQGSNYPIIENCYLSQTNVSVDYIYGVYFWSSQGRVQNIKMRNMKARVRGAGVMSDNSSYILCNNCDINGTTICYYTQAGTLTLYNPIVPSTSEKDYRDLSLGEIHGVILQ